MIAIPGDVLGDEIEFKGEEGTYTEEDRVLSALVGDVRKDTNTHTISVKGARNVRPLHKGCLVVGMVEDIIHSMAIVTIAPMDGCFAATTRALLKAEEIGRSIRNIRDALRIGDILKAKIKNPTPGNVQLTIQERGLGVIKAYCSKCRGELLLQRGNELVCRRCGHRERRRVAPDYVEVRS